MHKHEIVTLFLRHAVQSRTSGVIQYKVLNKFQGQETD